MAENFDEFLGMVKGKAGQSGGGASSVLVDAAFKAMDSDERYIAIVVGVAQHWFSSRIFWCLPSD